MNPDLLDEAEGLILDRSGISPDAINSTARRGEISRFKKAVFDKLVEPGMNRHQRRSLKQKIDKKVQEDINESRPCL